MSEKKFAAVIFDLDGVITDTARYHYLAWKAIASEVGVAFDEASNEALKGIDRMNSLQKILQTAPATYTEQEKLALADKKNLHYQQLIANMNMHDVLPGAVAALAAVRAAGLPIALASVSRNASFILQQLGIADCFDYVVDAAQIKNSKPDPEIFLNAAYALGVSPQHCLGVEDSIAGIAAIKSAGMRALGIGLPEILHQADVVIPSLEFFKLENY